MRLFEFESLEILKQSGIRVPDSAVISGRGNHRIPEHLIPGVVKAQVLSGRRMAAGGIQSVESVEEARQAVTALLSQSIGGEAVETLLFQERMQFECEYFAGITYDNRARGPFLFFSRQGGSRLDTLAMAHPERIYRLPLPSSGRVGPYRVIEWLADFDFRGKELKSLSDVLMNLIHLFFRHDAVLLEVNPLVKLRSGGFAALDCHVELDDEALVRSTLTSTLNLSGRTDGSRKLTDFEKKAREIDELDHRGVAGRVVEFPGDLALLIGGGGASLTIFDALRDSGARPANYCEIGGNPTVHKVEQLTKLLVTRPGVDKLAVIMNVVSNTRADLVARGVIKGLLGAGKDPGKTLVVFRLPGSGEEECRQLLHAYGVTFSGRELSIDEAARMATADGCFEFPASSREKHERVG